MSHTWIIEPHDPLIVRDGRPFGPTPGARAATLPFPMPSTLAGGVRTQSGRNNQGEFDLTPQEARKIAVAGPLLVELREDAVLTWFAPAPADALLLEAQAGQGERKWLQPLPDSPGSTNLPEGLMLVGMAIFDPRKPLKKPPLFWRWSEFEDWLRAPADDLVTLTELGIQGPQQEARIHVKIDSKTGTAEEGKLFQTRGLVFEEWERRLALAVRTEKSPAFALGPLGGERRLSAWRKSTQDFPALPDEVKKAIVQEKRCRVILLTPAIFQEGFRPTRLLKAQGGVQPTLEAVAVRRHRVVSGWDMETGKPKPTRRLAPAGSVFFLSLKGEDAAIEKWLEALWMQNVSDADQDNLDGFGLAVLGAWPAAHDNKEATL